jgi:hypothetical protein
MDGTCGTYRREERCIKGFVRKLEEKDRLGRRRRRKKNNIKMVLQEVRC